MPFTVPNWLEPVSVAVGTLVVVGGIIPAALKDRSRTREIDAAISADAYALRATLRVWIHRAEHLESLGVPYSILGEWVERKGVETRLERAVVSAANASRRVRRAINEAHRLYHKAVIPTPPEGIGGFLNDAVQERKRVAKADARACVESLTRAIDPGLRDS